jgi:hypothetical protein
MSFRPSRNIAWTALYTLTVLGAVAAVAIHALREPPESIYAMTDSFDAFAFTTEKPTLYQLGDGRTELQGVPPVRAQE